MMKERLLHPRRTGWVGWALDGDQGDEVDVNEEAGGHDEEERPHLLLHLVQPTLEPAPMASEALLQKDGARPDPACFHPVDMLSFVVP